MAEDGPKRKSRDETPDNGIDPTEKVAAAIRSITSNAGKIATPPAPASSSGPDARNGMLDALVYGDNDLIGLVAYAMHELNRRDWCVAYEAANGHKPTEAEAKAYLVGEQLERRLETYRRLSEDALAKLTTSDQSMRRLSEAAPAPPVAAPPAARAAIQPVAQPAPAPAPVALMPAPQPVQTQRAAPAYEPPVADDSFAPAPRKKNWAGLALYLLLLLVAVVALGYIINSGLIFPIAAK